MLGTRNPEVLVVGAGPVGLLAALKLANRGVRVGIVDREWRPGAHSYALALHARSLALLDELGLRDRVLEAAYPVRTVAVYDDAGERRAEMRLPGGDEAGGAGCVAVMRQDALEKLLADALKRAGVKVAWNHEVVRLVPEDDRVGVTINELAKDTVGYAVAHTNWVVARSSDFNVPWVVGADGHRSSVRRMLSVGFAESGPAQHFAVFEFKTTADLGDEMRLVLGEQTADVLWPLPDGYCRFSFELPDFSASQAISEKGSDPLGLRGLTPFRIGTKSRVPVEIGTARFPVLSEESLRTLLGERAPWFEGEVEEIRWRIVVRFERRLAEAFGRGRMWLAGDAGHITGPAGMQSMNVGLREADELAGILATVLRDRAPEEGVREYNKKRLEEWQFLLGIEGGLVPKPGADPWVAQNAGRLLPCIPAAGDDLEALAAQIGLERQ